MCYNFISLFLMFTNFLHNIVIKLQEYYITNLAITMNDQGARGSQTRWQLHTPVPTHWSSLPLESSLTWDHSSDIASNAMRVLHHHQNGNLIPLLPCYYQVDFNCFVDKVGNPIPDRAVIFINDFQYKYHAA